MFHTFKARNGRGRPAGSPRRRAHATCLHHGFSPAQHYCAALVAHVPAVVRSLRCYLVSFGRISARAPHIAPFKVARKPVCPCCRSELRRASCISSGTDRVCTVCSAVYYCSPLSLQLSFLCKHMLAVFALLFRARVPRSLAPARALSLLLPRCEPFDHAVPTAFLMRALGFQRPCGVHACLCAIQARNLRRRPSICFVL
jgi:hypothetical protein